MTRRQQTAKMPMLATKPTVESREILGYLCSANSSTARESYSTVVQAMMQIRRRTTRAARMQNWLYHDLPYNISTIGVHGEIRR